MFKNYFKLAIKVLGRRKFFTFISLFGISITLMILMLISAFLETELGSNQPMSEMDRMVILDQVTMKLFEKDTVLTIDSSLVNEVMQYDTTRTFEENNTSTSTGPPSYTLLNKHLREVQPVERYTFFSIDHQYDLFLNSRKLPFQAIFTDAEYWDVFDFEFLEGQPFNKVQIEQQQAVLVITDKAAKKYFGRTTDLLDEELKMGNYTYRIIGVVASPRSSVNYVLSDTYIPYTFLDQIEPDNPNFMNHSRATGVYLASSSSDREKVRKDIKQRVERLQIPNPDRFNFIEVTTTTFFSNYAHSILYFEDPEDSAFWVSIVFTVLILFFILLPTLNLINLNVSRMLERRSEIGIRKAFGADSGTILYQFVFENVIITFIGGIIGLILALILLNVINQSEVLPDTKLAFSYWVFIYSFFICLVFGIISGLLPAWRMSKIQIAEAIKSNQL